MITCYFENKNKALLRHVTVDALIIKNNKILLVKRASHLIEGGKYTLPGGYLDRDETLNRAVLREAREETGYNSEIVSLFRINDNPQRGSEDRQNVDFVFLVKLLDKVDNHDREVSEVKWFGLDDLPEKEKIAFDHYENIEFYLKYKQEKFDLPIFNI